MHLLSETLPRTGIGGRSVTDGAGAGGGIHAQEVAEGAKQGSGGVEIEGVGIGQQKGQAGDMGGEEGV